jgi:integrase
VVETRSTTMVRALRDVSDEILWYAQRGHWRFAYRDPYDGARRFLNCLPDRFEIAGIPLPSPDVVRRPTEEARRLCVRLKDELMGWLKSDPRATYRKPKEELRDPNPFTDAELEAFFGFTRGPSRFRPDGYAAAEWIGVGLLTLGLRPVELIGACWENVDFDERFLFVAESHGNKLK